jgi:branched-chain amino acid transport system substrate-binding protein
MGNGFPANQCWEAAYFQMHLLADALRRADPDDVESVRRALPGTEFDAPQGRVRIDEQNHHTHLHPRIGRADATGRFEILEQSRHRVRPDPYLVSHTLADWSVSTALQPGA